MSYDLMVFNKERRFNERNAFLKWYDDLIQWHEDVDYNDYKHTMPELQQWFLYMKDIVPPLNGELAPKDEDFGKGDFEEADYCIATEAIYVAFAWQDGEKVHQIVKDSAKKFSLAFFDITNNCVVYPDGFVLDLSETTSKKLSFLQKIKKVFGKM